MFQQIPYIPASCCSKQKVERKNVFLAYAKIITVWHRFSKVVRILIRTSKNKNSESKTHPKFTCRIKFFESVRSNNHRHLRTWEADKKRKAILPQSRRELVRLIRFRFLDDYKWLFLASLQVIQSVVRGAIPLFKIISPFRFLNFTRNTILPPHFGDFVGTSIQWWTKKRDNEVYIKILTYISVLTWAKPV